MRPIENPHLKQYFLFRVRVLSNLFIALQDQKSYSRLQSHISN